ncbi:C-glycoside deglycosidase beta subunit domain-containing protein [Herbinix luporum]|mgnify:CR=1 FL=1|uniref:C-glycoside deglycosidase beta subunit domain-containing protein n=1 Tax=Herbinix luporum TaxID=1679721 RepID=UPI0023F3D00D|nr:DUF6379 domain-containing protein [Herbinix luporum]
MFTRDMFNPEGFKNTVVDGKTIGFQFDFKLQYYRGVTLSIIRNIEVWVDGQAINREDIRFSIRGESFTLDEMKTVIDYRWLFGEWATVTVLKEGGLSKGPHHIKATQTIAPSYMPMILVHTGEYDFEI